ncbi:MAG: endonuclease III [Acidobacteria bacterium]|nr:endonuclease III [Acidobacteriota bacterium]
MRRRVENRITPKSRATRILRALHRLYPEAECALNHRNPLELMVATILSAQCTDERVNIVTATLFRKYSAAGDYLQVPASELEQDIRSINFFRNKARSIQGACQRLVELHGGQVPETIEELIELPGVGRKTANVILGTAFGIPSGIVVDTHVSRLSRRMGLTTEKTPEKIEADLIGLIPRREWIRFSHRLILHGRGICKARRPDCSNGVDV